MANQKIPVSEWKGLPSKEINAKFPDIRKCGNHFWDAQTGKKIARPFERDENGGVPLVRHEDCPLHA